ncbi:MAG: hypothetical protein JKX85_06230 [Phycisphaeraceae bacterium]|nr:hypothetical protein [Phycisphaeraceae bacterium]
MHTASNEHHSPIDSVQISEKAQQASTREMLEQAKREGKPVVQDIDAAMTVYVFAVVLIVVALIGGVIGLCYWAAGNAGRCLFLVSLLLVAAALVGAMWDKTNRRGIKF